jgi:outer membrane protein OmpA-like peptidoglycan-associated protein/tetratricopeptide (TPR) repeat protein
MNVDIYCKMNRVFKLRFLSALFLSFFVAIFCLGQDVKSTVKEAKNFAQELKALIDAGDKLFLKGSFSQALDSYFAANQKAPEDAKVIFKIGQTYLSAGAEAKAVPYLERAYRQQPNVDPDIDYYLATALQATSHFNRAIDHFKKFQEKNKKFTTIARHKIEECKFGDSLMRHPVLCNIKILEWPVNSRFQDYGPVLNSDEDKLIFTSGRDTTKTDKRYNTYFEDILMSSKNGETWSVPERLSANVNDQFHDAATYLTPSGKTIYLYYEKGNGDIYQSDYDGSEWSVPRSMGKEINSVSWETSGCLSPDGSRFFFASDRPGGYGNLDLYVCNRLPSGEWGKAVNMGAKINSRGSEDAPFVHPDGTLYFGSDGHPGLGEFDIFKSELVDGEWSKPVNIGYPINTAKFENYFFLSNDKKRAYFSAVRSEGVGNSDICMVHFLDPPPPPPVEQKAIAKVDTARDAETIGDEFVDAMVSFQKDLGLATQLTGKVLDSDKAFPLKAQIVLVDNKTNSVIERVYSDGVTGEFKIIIPHGGNYGINTSVNGYLFNSLNFDVPMFSDYKEIETAIFMQKAEVGSKIVLRNIFFDMGKSDLQNESVSELESILNLMERNPLIKLQINGHTDNTGDDATNKILSLKRAQAVADFLVKRGINTNRLRAIGYGEERPIVSNDDEAGGKEVNRRTEIEVFETQPQTGN